MNKKTVIIALGKGRGFQESLDSVKIDKSNEYSSFEEGRVPVYFDHKNNIQLVKVRNKDLPWLLAKNHVNAAIGSSVWFDEFSQPGVKLYTRLPFMNCRLSLISAKKIPVGGITTICSKFLNITRRYLVQNKLSPTIVSMEGCHEVALSLGVSDAIIDIVETGNTIKQLNFTELDCISTISHGIWIKENNAPLEDLLNDVFKTPAVIRSHQHQKLHTTTFTNSAII